MYKQAYKTRSDKIKSALTKLLIRQGRAGSASAAASGENAHVSNRVTSIS